MNVTCGTSKMERQLHECDRRAKALVNRVMQEPQPPATLTIDCVHEAKRKIEANGASGVPREAMDCYERAVRRALNSTNNRRKGER